MLFLRDCAEKSAPNLSNYKVKYSRGLSSNETACMHDV